MSHNSEKCELEKVNGTKLFQALDDLQFSYQEQICEHQDKIEELLRNNETATENAEAEMAHLQQKYDEKMRKG